MSKEMRDLKLSILELNLERFNNRGIINKSTINIGYNKIFNVGYNVNFCDKKLFRTDKETVRSYHMKYDLLDFMKTPTQIELLVKLLIVLNEFKKECNSLYPILNRTFMNYFLMSNTLNTDNVKIFLFDEYSDLRETLNKLKSYSGIKPVFYEFEIDIRCGMKNGKFLELMENRELVGNVSEES